LYSVAKRSRRACSSASVKDGKVVARDRHDVVID
jgi:hypothetical protein